MKRKAAENLDKQLVKKSRFSHKKPPFRTLNPTDSQSICYVPFSASITMENCKLDPKKSSIF